MRSCLLQKQARGRRAERRAPQRQCPGLAAAPAALGGAGSAATSAKSALSGMHVRVREHLWGSWGSPSGLMPVVMLDVGHLPQSHHQLRQPQWGGNAEGQLRVLQVSCAEPGEEMEMCTRW